MRRPVQSDTRAVEKLKTLKKINKWSWKQLAREIDVELWPLKNFVLRGTEPNEPHRSKILQYVAGQMGQSVVQPVLEELATQAVKRSHKQQFEKRYDCAGDYFGWSFGRRETVFRTLSVRTRDGFHAYASSTSRLGKIAVSHTCGAVLQMRGRLVFKGGVAKERKATGVAKTTLELATLGLSLSVRNLDERCWLSGEWLMACDEREPEATPTLLWRSAPGVGCSESDPAKALRDASGKSDVATLQTRTWPCYRGKSIDAFVAELSRHLVGHNLETLVDAREVGQLLEEIA